MDQPKLELSFEYLLSKDRLQWITVHSSQVIFLSLCLQSMVEELMRKNREGISGSCSSNFSQASLNIKNRNSPLHLWIGLLLLCLLWLSYSWRMRSLKN